MEDTTTLASLMATQNRTRLAERLGITRATIHRWIAEDGVPNAAILPALADALRVDLAELVHIVARTAERISARKAA